ncbi:MAG: NTPase [Nitrospirae bacterium]|nr:NTPase [Nitrospirota bacterium]MBI5694688.1 NTPase [Nitrospirota bacterium]
MTGGIKPSCVICAWRATCNKKFSIINPSTCPDYSFDVTIKEMPGMKGVKVLMEGAPGVGKTTLVERLVTRLYKEKRLGGFFTREIREGGERKGFRIITLDKMEGVLAHVEFTGGMRVGRYAVDIEALERVGVASVERAIKEDNIVVIDEIGKMELLSGHFRDVVEVALNSENALVATAPSDGTPFADEVKKRPDVRHLTLTAENRDELLDEVVKLLTR